MNEFVSHLGAHWKLEIKCMSGGWGNGWLAMRTSRESCQPYNEQFMRSSGLSSVQESFSLRSRLRSAAPLYWLSALAGGCLPRFIWPTLKCTPRAFECVCVCVRAHICMHVHTCVHMLLIQDIYLSYSDNEGALKLWQNYFFCNDRHCAKVS